VSEFETAGEEALSCKAVRFGWIKSIELSDVFHPCQQARPPAIFNWIHSLISGNSDAVAVAMNVWGECALGTIPNSSQVKVSDLPSNLAG